MRVSSEAAGVDCRFPFRLRCVILRAMTSETENLVLELLRSIRGDIGQLRNEVRDVKERLGSVELSVIAMRRDLTRVDESIAHVHARIDRLGDRVERIEIRLGLVDSPIPHQ